MSHPLAKDAEGLDRPSTASFISASSSSSNAPASSNWHTGMRNAPTLAPVPRPRAAGAAGQPSGVTTSRSRTYASTTSTTGAGASSASASTRARVDAVRNRQRSAFRASSQYNSLGHYDDDDEDRVDLYAQQVRRRGRNQYRGSGSNAALEETTSGVNSGSSLLRSRLANRFANTFGARGGPDTRTSGGQDEVLGACYGSASSGDWRHASDLYYYTSQIVIWVAIIDVYAICILLLYFFNRLSVSCEGDNFLAAWLSTGLTGSLPTTILVDNIARRTTFRTAFVWESLFTLCSILWFCGGMALVISFAPVMVDDGVLQKRISCAGHTGGTTTDSNGDDPASTSTTDGQLQAASASCPPAAEDDEVDIAITIEDTSCQSMLWTTCLGITLFHSTCFTLFTIFSLATTVLPALLKLVIRSLFMNANSAKKSEAAGADRASGASGGGNNRVRSEDSGVNRHNDLVREVEAELARTPSVTDDAGIGIAGHRYQEQAENSSTAGAGAPFAIASTSPTKTRARRTGRRILEEVFEDEDDENDEEQPLIAVPAGLSAAESVYSSAPVTPNAGGGSTPIVDVDTGERRKPVAQMSPGGPAVVRDERMGRIRGRIVITSGGDRESPCGETGVDFEVNKAEGHNNRPPGRRTTFGTPVAVATEEDTAFEVGVKTSVSQLSV